MYWPYSLYNKYLITLKKVAFVEKGKLKVSPPAKCGTTCEHLFKE